MAADKQGSFEGHGDAGSPKPSVSKGELIGACGTYAPLSTEATSVNQKSGHIGDAKTKA